MKPKNRYYKRSRITESQFRLVLKHFCTDLTAENTAELVGLNRNTIHALYAKFRERIAELIDEKYTSNGEYELDESYFGPTRVRGQK